MSNFVIVNGVLTQYTGTEREVIVPEEVTAIGDGAFSCSGIKSIQLPGKLKKIMDRAFQRCDDLTQIDIPDSVTVIGKSAFAYSGLERVKLPAKIKTIKEYSFGGTQLKCVTLPEGVKTIENYAFQGCRKLESVTLSAHLEKIQTAAFENCAVLRQIDLAPNVVVMGRVFDFCVGLADENGFIVVNGALYKSPALYRQHHVVLPDGVKIIKAGSIDIRREMDGVMYVADREEFMNARKNEVGGVIEIPASVEVIESGAFLGDVTEIISHSTAGFGMLSCSACTRLSKLTVPKGTQVDSSMFGFGAEGEKLFQKLQISLS